MPRKAKARIGRPPGSKNKTNQIVMAALTKPVKRMGRPKKVSVMCEPGTQPVVVLQTMLWDSLREVQCNKMDAAELRRVLTQTSDLLNVLEAQAK